MANLQECLWSQYFEYVVRTSLTGAKVQPIPQPENGLRVPGRHAEASAGQASWAVRQPRSPAGAVSNAGVKAQSKKALRAGN